jgi:hypothetical protein
MARVTAKHTVPQPSITERWMAVLLVSAAVALSGCNKFRRKHIPVESVPDRGYPTCQGAVPPPGELVGEGHLRSGPTHPDKTIVERFSVRQRDCLWSATVRQEWPMGTADLEVLYDASFLPLRIWKRMSLPGSKQPAKELDIRRYDLRAEPVEVKRRHPDGHVDYELIKGERPRAVIGPGRGLISMWIRRARLQPGHKVREVIIDVRGGLETIEPVTLLREPDLQHPELGKVRVYTFYGRETVFADANDIVVGDLAGLRPHALLESPPPAAIPLFAPLDPVHTP